MTSQVPLRQLIEQHCPSGTSAIVIDFYCAAIEYCIEDRSNPFALKRALQDSCRALNLFDLASLWEKLAAGPLSESIRGYRKRGGYEDAERAAGEDGEDGEDEIEDVLTAVVPLEEPVQMSFDMLNISEPPEEACLDVGEENVSLDWLSSRKVLSSQVDRGKLERTAARHKRRADKRSNVAQQQPKQAAKAPDVSASMLEDILYPSSAEGDHRQSRDVKLENFDIAIGGKRILTDAGITIAFGRRYGLVGRNGVGKSTLLRYLSSRQLSVPPHISILHVEQEVQGDDTPAIKSVLAADFRRELLTREERRLVALLDGSKKPSAKDADMLSSRLQLVYRRLEEFDADRAEAR